MRKQMRLNDYDYSSAGIYFITICVKNKRPLLGEVVGDAALGVPQANKHILPEEPVGDAALGVPYEGDNSSDYQCFERINLQEVR